MTDTQTTTETSPAAATESVALYLSGAPRLSTRSNTESLGPRSHILGVINALEQSGYDVQRFIVGDSTSDSLHTEGSEARISASAAHLVAADLARVWFRLRSRRKLRRTIALADAAFSYERYALMQELGSVPRKHGIPWILEVNALLAIEATTERRATTSRRVAAAFERRTLRSADLIVAVTDALSTALQSTYGIAAERILVIENGVDATAHPRASGVPLDTPTIGFLGSLYPWQRVDALLQAMVDERNAGWRLRVAGAGPELEALREQTLQLGLEGRVEFLGRVHPDDVPAFLQSVDVCYAGHASSNGVYFSPLKLWEYLAAGRAVVASAHSTTLGLESDGYPVRCFTDDPGSLADLLAELLSQRAELAGLGARRQPDVWREYSWTARISPLLARMGQAR